ncbi:putative zinc finger in N-recognin-domain-containing protein [Scheffersomyces coipomensis]|uniref:putative zinc finger in N-recognin-domain-containing protein n=1 Tax=Scheffersomyces coipomensis TaxID=1788519 RepID=UPI00315CF040
MSQQSEDAITAIDYIQSQERLEKEAKRLMPFEPDDCTYSLGEIRQPIFACLTCSKENNNTSIGVCYSCSIQCHSTHELVELFSKRNYVCDCGTSRMKHTINGACKLRNQVNEENPRSRSSSGVFKRPISFPADDIPSSSNVYNQNFKGLFCSCEKQYDPVKETGNMIQCFLGSVCGEDWYHEECILGYEPGTFTSVTKSDIKEDIKSEENAKESSVGEINENSDVKVPHFPDLESFDSFICWKCVSYYESVFQALKDDTEIIHSILPHFDQISNSKEWYQKYQNFKSQSNQSESVGKKIKLEKDPTKATYSIFLKLGFKEKMKDLIEILGKETELYQFLISNDFLYNNDPIYEPPEEDSDDGASSTTGSLLDLGSEALSTLPREKAIEGIQALDKISSKLRDFLKPFAEQGKVVTEDEVRDFFAKVKEKQLQK